MVIPAKYSCCCYFKCSWCICVRVFGVLLGFFFLLLYVFVFCVCCCWGVFFGGGSGAGGGGGSYLNCSAQLSMFNMEKCYRNKIIIIINLALPGQWTCSTVYLVVCFWYCYYCISLCLKPHLCVCTSINNSACAWDQANTCSAHVILSWVISLKSAGSHWSLSHVPCCWKVWRISIPVCWLVAKCPSNMLVYLRDGSAQTILCAATLR